MKHDEGRHPGRGGEGRRGGGGLRKGGEGQGQWGGGGGGGRVERGETHVAS